MVSGRQKYSIEEYSFSQSTLEQVFLAFAKKQHEDKTDSKYISVYIIHKCSLPVGSEEGGDGMGYVHLVNSPPILHPHPHNSALSFFVFQSEPLTICINIYTLMLITLSLISLSHEVPYDVTLRQEPHN